MPMAWPRKLCELQPGGLGMTKRWSTEKHIIGILKQHEGDQKVALTGHPRYLP